jgi:hypothetical protein
VDPDARVGPWPGGRARCARAVQRNARRLGAATGRGQRAQEEKAQEDGTRDVRKEAAAALEVVHAAKLGGFL